VGRNKAFLCSRIRENSGRPPGRHPNSHESGYAQYAMLDELVKELASSAFHA
jgi:hypothetical protein